MPVNQSKKLVVSNILLLGCNWARQFTTAHTDLFVPQPIGLLVGLTLIYALSQCLPPTLKRSLQADFSAAFFDDLHRAFLVYNLLLFLNPSIFSPANLNDHYTAVGLGLALGVLPIPYFADRRIWGLRIRDPQARQNWVRTKLLGQRIGFVTGTVSVVLGTISAIAFFTVLTIGLLILGISLPVYLTHLNRRHK